MFTSRQHTYQHPPGVAPCCRQAWSSAPSHPCTGPPSSSELRPPLPLVIYGHPEVRPGLVYLLSAIIRQIAGGKKGIILSADVSPSEWDRTGLGYGSFKVDAEIQPCSLCPLHTLWRRRSRPAASHRLRTALQPPLALLSNNFTIRPSLLYYLSKYSLFLTMQVLIFLKSSSSLQIYVTSPVTLEISSLHFSNRCFNNTMFTVQIILQSPFLDTFLNFIV